MKDFDLAAAKRGATVCTREGNRVKILLFDLKNGPYEIVAIIKTKSCSEYINIYNSIGHCCDFEIDLDDLMMADDDYLEKLERGEYDHIEDNHEMAGRIIPYRDVTNSVELITPFDDDYWRKLYAGMAMQGFCRENVTMNPASTVAIVSVEYADALIEELKRR